MLPTILLVFAFVLACIAAVFPPPAWPWGRFHFGWLAFAFYLASLLFGGGARLAGLH